MTSEHKIRAPRQQKGIETKRRRNREEMAMLRGLSTTALNGTIISTSLRTLELLQTGKQLVEGGVVLSDAEVTRYIRAHSTTLRLAKAIVSEREH